MKKGIIILMLSLGVQSYGQDIFTTAWQLIDLEIEGVHYSPPSNSEVPWVVASFIMDNPDYFESGVCNAIYAEIVVEENPGIINFPEGISITLSECNDPDNAIFEGLYYSGFFESYINEPFSYVVTIIDGGGTYPDGLGLSITNANGDNAYYLDTILSVPDASLSEIILFPNPVTNEFFVSFDAISEKTNLTIYNILGEIVLSKNDYKSNSYINIQHLKSGIYFVSISDAFGNTTVKKISKL